MNIEETLKSFLESYLLKINNNAAVPFYQDSFFSPYICTNYFEIEASSVLIDKQIEIYYYPILGYYEIVQIENGKDNVVAKIKKLKNDYSEYAENELLAVYKTLMVTKEVLVIKETVTETPEGLITEEKIIETPEEEIVEETELVDLDSVEEWYNNLSDEEKVNLNKEENFLLDLNLPYSEQTQEIKDNILRYYEQQNKFAKGGYAKGNKIKNKYSNKFEEVLDLSNELYYIRDFGFVETEGKGNIDLVAVATIRDLKEYVSKEELPKEGNFMLDITLVPYEKYISKEHKQKANNEDNNISHITIVNIVNYMGGLNYHPQEKIYFKTSEAAQKYLYSKELNDKISAEAVMSGYILDKFYNRAGQTNWDFLAYITGESKKFFSKGVKLVGASHANGGIKVIAPNGMIEVEGGEVIINKKAADQNCELLSEINQSAGGGVAFPCRKAENGLLIEKPGDLEEIAKYMVRAVNKQNWALFDLIYYFEKDNNFDYKNRVAIIDSEKALKMPKTYDNILKLLKEIVAANENNFPYYIYDSKNQNIVKYFDNEIEAENFSSKNNNYEVRINEDYKAAKGAKIYKDLDFKSIEEYFDYIGDSYINGNHSQVKELYNKMNSDQKKTFFNYAKKDDYLDGAVNYINNSVRKFAKGAKVADIKYSEILEVLKDKIENIVDDTPYENDYEYTGEEVEHISRSGFIPFTDGGYRVQWFEYLNQLSGSGKRLPTKVLQDEMENQVGYNYKLAKDWFLEEYPTIVKELGKDNIDYHTLYEKGYGEEAERLSEKESDYEGDDSVLMQIFAYYYSPENSRGEKGKHTISLQGDVNLESPYHRAGNLDDGKEITFTFDSIADLEKQMDANLKTILEWFEGSDYKKSKTEMKIRRMKNGGVFRKKKMVIPKIENQYKGKSAKEIWNTWTKKQRSHFLTDHKDRTGKVNTLATISLPYSELNRKIKDAVLEHKGVGQYKKGTKIKKRTKKGIAQDKRTKALKPGKRISENGNTYYEYRENRSDKSRTKKI